MKIVPLSRRTLLAGSAASPLLLGTAARAQTIIPDKGLTMLVGFVANGGTDIIARKIAVKIERRVGRHLLVQNRPGGPGGIPGEILKKDSGDGSVVGFLASTTLISKLVVPDFPFDPLTDINGISLAGNWPIGLVVSPKLGIKTFDEYVKWVKEGDPKRMKLGSTASDAFIEAFSRMAGHAMGISFQPTPFRGAAPMVADLSEGRLSAAVSGTVSLLQHHRGGRVRLLMTTGPKRLASTPDVPTARELGFPGLEDTEWFGLFASAKTPRPLIDEWNRQVRAVLSDKLLITELGDLGLEVQTSTPDEANARVAEHMKRWMQNLKDVGMASR